MRLGNIYRTTYREDIKGMDEQQIKVFNANHEKLYKRQLAYTNKLRENTSEALKRINEDEAKNSLKQSITGILVPILMIGGGVMYFIIQEKKTRMEE